MILFGRSSGANKETLSMAYKILTQMQQIEPRTVSITTKQYIELDNQVTDMPVYRKLASAWLDRAPADVPVIEIGLPLIKFVDFLLHDDPTQGHQHIARVATSQLFKAVQLLDEKLKNDETWKTISERKLSAYDNQRYSNPEFLIDFSSIRKNLGFCCTGDEIVLRVPAQVHLYGEPDIKRMLINIQQAVSMDMAPTR